MGDDELLACPFCGGTPYERSYRDESLHSHATVKWYAVTCGNCDIHFDSEDREEIVRMWNTRTPTAEVENLRAKANGEPSPEFPNLIIIDTPEGREAFARECFEAGLHNRTHYLDNFRQYFMRYSDTYQTADDFIEKLREENKL